MRHSQALWFSRLFWAESQALLLGFPRYILAPAAQPTATISPEELTRSVGRSAAGAP